MICYIYMLAKRAYFFSTERVFSVLNHSVLILLSLCRALRHCVNSVAPYSWCVYLHITRRWSEITWVRMRGDESETGKAGGKAASEVKSLLICHMAGVDVLKLRGNCLDVYVLLCETPCLPTHGYVQVCVLIFEVDATWCHFTLCARVHCTEASRFPQSWWLRCESA